MKRVNLASWARLLLIYNLVMLALGVPLAVYGYHAVHEFLPEFRNQFALSWSVQSVIVVCIVVGVAADLIFLLGPLAEFCLTRWTRLSFGRRLRLGVFGGWLAVSLFGVGSVLFEFLWLPVSMM